MGVGAMMEDKGGGRRRGAMYNEEGMKAATGEERGRKGTREELFYEPIEVVSRCGGKKALV